MVNVWKSIFILIFFMLKITFRCNSGYYPENNICYKCDESCKECDGPLNSNCLIIYFNILNRKIFLFRHKM